MAEQRDTTDAAQRRTERLDLLGSLARPVQHEINNLLTVIYANLDLLKRRMSDAAPLRQIGRVEEAARRFEATSRAILALSRRPVPGEAVVSPGAALEALQPLLGVLMPAPGTLSVTIAAGIPPCRFDQALFDGALVGLARAAGAARVPLRLAVSEALGVAVLEARTEAEVGDAAAALARLAAEAGGRLAAEPGLLRLTLPVAPPG